MQRHRHPMPWVWVQEYGDTFGQHAHILLHVPEELEPLFRPMPLRWTKALLAGDYVAGTLQTQRLAAAYRHTANPALYDAVLRGKLAYMLKCAPAPFREPLGLDGWEHKPWNQSSRVLGKRAGAWQVRNWEN
jgi:hypothetical protein